MIVHVKVLPEETIDVSVDTVVRMNTGGFVASVDGETLKISNSGASVSVSDGTLSIGGV